MAIDLPPVIPPQLSTAEKIEERASATGAAIVAEVAGTELRISGNRYLSEAQVRDIAAASKTPSQAIRALNQAYYSLGHLLITVYYAERDSVIHVHVVNGELAGIEAPEPLRSHFLPLLGDKSLTASEFERRRILADLQASRTGHDYTMSYRAGANPEDLTLVFKQSKSPDYRVADFSLDVGNQGNRFVGRYFAGADMSYRFWQGAELSLGYETALVEWGDTSGGRNYDGIRLSLDKPLRFGLYGAELHYVTYDRDVILVNPGEADTSFLCVAFNLCNDAPATLTPVVVDGETQVAALTGEQVLLANHRQRLTATQRLEAVDSEITLDDGRLVQDEPYTSAEVGLKYFRRAQWWGFPTRWSAQAFVKGGLSGDDGTLGTEQDAPEAVAAGKRRAGFLLFKPRLGLKLDVSSKLSVALDVLGQYADGEQLPQEQQFVLGGLSTLSAYLPGTLVGDTGLYTRLKLERTPWRPFDGAALTPSLFVEYGEARFEDVSGPLSATRSLVDAGLRIEGSIGWGLNLSLVAAVPVSDRNLEQEQLDASEVDFYWQLKKAF